MTFEFMYGDAQFKYENGWIYRKNPFDYYEDFCPVHSELISIVESLNIDQFSVILGAIIHGYSYGKNYGKAEKIQEFKRVFNL